MTIQEAKDRAAQDGERKLTLIDNDFYFESDEDGYNPMGGKELFELYKEFNKSMYGQK